MVIVPHLVADNIISWLPRLEYPIQDLNHIKEYPIDMIFVRGNIKYVIEEDNVVIIEAHVYYKPYNIRTLKTLRLVCGAFLDILRVDVLEQKYCVKLFRKQCSALMYWNYLLSESLLWYVFPQPVEAPLYYAWKRHQLHRLSGVRSLSCPECFQTRVDKFNYMLEIINMMRNEIFELEVMQNHILELEGVEIIHIDANDDNYWPPDPFEDDHNDLNDPNYWDDQDDDQPQVEAIEPLEDML